MAQLDKRRGHADVDGALEHGSALAVQFGVYQAGYKTMFVC